MGLNGRGCTFDFYWPVVHINILSENEISRFDVFANLAMRLESRVLGHGCFD